MIDEIFDRHYQAGRADLNAGLDRLFTGIGRAVGDGLKALHRVEWDAPWAAEPKTATKKVRSA